MQAHIAERDATTSDHWPLSFTLLPNIPTHRPKPTGNREARKPTGWVIRELDFNDGIRERVGMNIPVDIAELMKDAYHIYTDGSFTGHRSYTAKAKHNREKQAPNKTAPKAGWGVAVFKKGPPPQDEEDAYALTGNFLEADPTSSTPYFDGKLCGRVTTTAEANAGAHGHVGALKKTNNTAEVQAVIEALFFLSAQLDEDLPLIKPQIACANPS